MKKVVLLTGATGGLGLAVAEAFLCSGWHVHAAVRTDEQSEQLKKSFSKHKSALSTCIADLTREDDTKQYVRSSPAQFHACVHLAGGYNGGSPVEKTSMSTLEHMLSVNLLTAFILLRAVIPAMRKNGGGSIVTIGAKTVLTSGVNNAAYALSKAALASLTQSVAEEGKAHNIRANCILPGVIVTPDNLSWASKGEEKKWTKPEDIASAILFLCSDSAEGINGALLPMLGKLPV